MSLPSTSTQSTWQHWLRRPQQLGFRKILFKIHLWCGIALGLYIFFISITGSVLVYRNELYEIVTPEPEISTAPGPALTDEALTESVQTQYPDYDVVRIIRWGGNPAYDVEVWINQDTTTRRKFFDVYTGEEKGSASPGGIQLVSGLISLHEEFLSGDTGRRINGFAAMAVVLLLITGLVLWWPGIHRWKRNLRLHRGVGWRRTVWDFHSMTGIWCFTFMMVFAISGIYLCFPQAFHSVAEIIQPSTPDNAGRRLVDHFLYWLAFLHFGRIDGIGIPCDGPGLCDQSVKATWAFFGLAPAVMIITGTLMWWNRSLRRRFRKH